MHLCFVIYGWIIIMMFNYCFMIDVYYMVFHDRVTTFLRKTRGTSMKPFIYVFFLPEKDCSLWKLQ